MSVWMPSFYPTFRCRAAACRHSCCRGWEIDVDERSAALYRSLPGELGEELRRVLYEDGEGWHFRLTAEDRCPLLQPDGLCRLIREQGEEALCDICALHPRFFQELDGEELWGLGLSCEAVTELLLSSPSLRFVCRETGEERDLAGLLRALGLDFPPELLQYHPQIDEARRRELLFRFRDTEPIDGAWPRELDALEAASLPWEAEEDRYRPVFEYLLFRQLERLGERSAAALVAYAGLCTDLLVLWDALEPDTAAHLRRISEQIEYSTENVDRLLDSGK